MIFFSWKNNVSVTFSKVSSWSIFFLKSLKDGFIKIGCPLFDLPAQQDVVEVLEILLEELTGLSIVISAAYNIKNLTSIICHTCHQLNRTENILSILCLAVLKDFPTSLAKVLETIFDWVQCSILQYLLMYKRMWFQAFFIKCWRLFNSATYLTVSLYRMVLLLRTLHHFLFLLPLGWLLN